MVFTAREVTVLNKFGVVIGASARAILRDQTYKIFGWGNKEDEPFDRRDASARLREGLDRVSDADARNTGEMGGYGNLKDLTIEEAETARRLADTLDPNQDYETEDEERKGWGWW